MYTFWSDGHVRISQIANANATGVIKYHLISLLSTCVGISFKPNVSTFTIMMMGGNFSRDPKLRQSISTAMSAGLY